MKKVLIVVFLCMGILAGCGSEIDEARAREIAVEKFPKADIVSIEYDKEDGKYEIELRDKETEYNIEIDAKSGAVTEEKKEELNNAGSNAIDENKAKEIALSKVPGGKVTECNYDSDDKTPNFDVTVVDANYEYEFEINAVDGSIVETSKETLDADDKVSNGATNNTENTTPPTTGTKPPTTTSPQNPIGEEKAKEIVLGKVLGGKVMECTYDGDDATPNYEITVHDEKYEYDFEVNAYTGEIMSEEKELLE